jgi:hypothetical protein
MSELSPLLGSKRKLDRAISFWTHCGSACPQRCPTEFGLALAVINGALLSTVFDQFAPSFGGWLPMVRSEP